jgi:hypothetical protein
MNSRELVDHIRSGPADLDLCRPLRFRRRTWFNWRFNPCDFDELLQALQSSTTIQDVHCGSHLLLCITEEEWVRLVKTLGRITDIKNLTLKCCAGSRHFNPFQAFADAVQNAKSLHTLEIYLGGRTFTKASSELTELTELASSLRERDFRWFDYVSRLHAAPVDLSPDHVLQILPGCLHLRKVSITSHCASTGAMKTLLQLPEDTDLTLYLTTKEDWLAVTDGIREGQCNIKHLSLVLLQSSNSEITEAFKAIASAIQLDRNLESLDLEISNSDFTDEAGMALVEALTVNKTLHKITLSLEPFHQGPNIHVLSAPTYDAFSAMLRVNTSLVLDLTPFAHPSWRGDQRVADSRNQMRIEERLNHVGRGRLVSSSQWVDALNDLNSFKDDRSPEFSVSCLYSLLRLNPATCM